MTLFQGLAADLAGLESQGRFRTLTASAGKDFSSNDYLGLANSPALRAAVAEALARGVAVGAGGSRLLRGNDAEHVALEAEAADFFGAESALFLANGFIANAAIFSTLPQRGDLILYDALIHASAHEGIRLSRAEACAVPHNDLAAYAAAIAAWQGTGRVWIAVESLYSMDGDIAPLAELMALAEAHDAILIIDEAHATGVYGAGGRGLAAHLEGRGNIITLHTLGKALGCEGALICGPQIVRDFLINRARGFIFSTAPSPLMAAAARASLRLIGGNMDRQTRLAALVAHAGIQFQEKLGITSSGSHIQPVIIGENDRTMAVAAIAQAAGFDVRGIRPPTVPVGTSRLRISLTLNVDEADVDALVSVLAEAMR